VADDQNTALYDAIVSCIELAEKTFNGLNCRIIVLTDGGDTFSAPKSREIVDGVYLGDLTAEERALKFKNVTFVCVGQGNAKAAKASCTKLEIPKFVCITEKNIENRAEELRNIVQLKKLNRKIKKQRKKQRNVVYIREIGEKFMEVEPITRKRDLRPVKDVPLKRNPDLREVRLEDQL